MTVGSVSAVGVLVLVFPLVYMVFGFCCQFVNVSHSMTHDCKMYYLLSNSNFLNLVVMKKELKLNSQAAVAGEHRGRSMSHSAQVSPHHTLMVFSGMLQCFILYSCS